MRKLQHTTTDGQSRSQISQYAVHKVHNGNTHNCMHNQLDGLVRHNPLQNRVPVKGPCYTVRTLLNMQDAELGQFTEGLVPFRTAFLSFPGEWQHAFKRCSELLQRTGVTGHM